MDKKKRVEIAVQSWHIGQGGGVGLVLLEVYKSKGK